MAELRDEELMQMFCSGRTEAFQVLFDKYKDRIFRFIYGAYERNPTQAEDCTQETFMRMVKNRDSFNPAMRFSTWLFTIARNYCLNQIRSKKLSLEIHFDETEMLHHAGGGEGADKILLDSELGIKIRQALALLPENLRSIFILREIDGLSHAEISEILNLKESNVRTQLHRAKKQLQNIISPYLEGENEK